MAFGETFLLGNGQPSAFNDRWMSMGGHYCEGVAPGDQAASPLQACEVITSGTFGATIRPGWVYIKGDHLENQGFYCSFNGANVTVANPNGAPGAAASQRIDLLVVQINDPEATVDTVPTPGVATPRWVAGSVIAGTGALADYSGTGALPGSYPALPASAILLAAAEIRTGDATITRLADLRRFYGPGLWGQDGKRYRLGVDEDGAIGLEDVTLNP